MNQQYRMKRTRRWVRTESRRIYLYCPTFIIQVRKRFGRWVTVKRFFDAEDPGFARREAEELLDKLNED